MAISKKRKEDLVAQYVELLSNARGIVVTEYRGMSMPQLDAIRSKLREVNSSYTITKNTLLRIAMEQVGMPVPVDLLKGPVALVVAQEDLPSTVKAVLDFADNNDVIVLKGGMMGEDQFGPDKLKAISELPSLDELRAQLLGMMTMPMTQFLGLLEEPGRQVVGVLKAATDGIVNVLAAYSEKDAA